MTEPNTSDPGRWVGGDLESGSDPEDSQPSTTPAGGGGGTTGEEKGVGIGADTGSSFEPEEDAG